MKGLVFGFLATALVSLHVSAQPGPAPQNPPAPVPITGIEYLLVGGGIYGIYRFSKRNKKNEV